MEKRELNEKIEEASKSIRSYCMAWTKSPYDADDLAQEIILEICKSAANIRDDRAFYGFMWSVAGNVRKQWYRKRRRTDYCELREELACETKELFDTLAEDSDIRRLRRELGLLAEKYRRAVVLYYLENKTCPEIAGILSVSESMVKYLLFKSRQIVKDGMGMERDYGEQSYNPKTLDFCFWGGTNYYERVCRNKISQNILFACFNDKLNGEQISLEIGVALPYIEENLKELVEYGLLRRDGNRYYTNIVIITKECQREIAVKTGMLKNQVAEGLKNVINEKEEPIRRIGFRGADMGRNTYCWQMSCILLRQAIIERLQEQNKLEYPVDKFGNPCFLWYQERVEEKERKNPFAMGRSYVSNEGGDEIQFMDFPINGDMVHHYFFNRQDFVNLFLDIARDKTESFSKNDRIAIEEMVKRGYVKNENEKLKVNVLVFTEEEYERLLELLKEGIETVVRDAQELLDEVARILRNHIPVHLKKLAKDMACLQMFHSAVSAPIKLLYEDGFLLPSKEGELLPTTYVILK